MQYARCKCGKSEYWHSGMPVHDCMGCDECKTTYSGYPEGHRELKKHTPKKQFNQNTGELSHYICEVCYERCDEHGNSIKRDD